MYEIERKDGRVIVRKGEHPKLNAPEGSYLVYHTNTGNKVSRIKDLTDEQLLLALASVVDLPSL